MVDFAQGLEQARATGDQNDLLQKKKALEGLRKRLGSEDHDQRLREACEGFESLFIHKLWQQMRQSVPKGGMLQSKEQEQYLAMFDQEMSKQLAEQGGIGLGDMLYRQLKLQGTYASRNTSPPATGEPLPLHKGPEQAMPLASLDQGRLELKAVQVRTVLQEQDAPADASPEANATAVRSVPLADEAGFDDSPENLYAPVDQTDAADRARPVNDEVPLYEQGIPLEPMPGDSAATGAARPDGVQGRVDELADAIERHQGAVLAAGGPSASQGARYWGMPAQDVMPAMHWPAQGPVSSDFGWRDDPFTGERAWHSGMDVAANYGDPVRAAWDGRVIFSGEYGGYGNLVVVEHDNGWRSYYGHNSENGVSVGQSVQAGQKIAEVGSSGRSTGPHLHFELRQGDLAWNPEQIRERVQAGLSVGRDA